MEPKIVVVGAGTMGRGITQVFAQHGYSVALVDLDRSILDRALAQIGGSLRRLAEKGKLSVGEAEKALGLVSTALDMSGAAQAELVIEAIVEELEAKAKLFAQLDSTAGPSTILASNTSSISITKLASVTKRPQKVIGMHFMNPVPVMELVEVIRGQATSDETLGRVVELATSLGKTPVEVRDSPGFVSNRVLMPLINEAIFAVFEGVATPEAIDQVLKLGMNHPMGPLALADFIGLDVCLAILEVLHEGFGDPKYRPCPLLKRMVDAHWLGRKTGRGFYRYDSSP